MGLTLKRIAAAQKPGRYADGRGLYLQVGKKSTRSWLLRYVIKGRERWMGLGGAADFTLDEARERARAARQLLTDGVDPIEARNARHAAEAAATALAVAKAMTFDQAAQEYYKMHASTWSARHAQQFKSAMRDYVLPRIGALSVADVDVGQVLRCIEPDWPTKAPTMMRTRSRIEAILAWATVRGYRQGDNPARWTGNLSEALPAPSKVTKVTHFTALPYIELPAFMHELKALPGIPARALEFLILTAARTGEVVGAMWDEFDLDAALWTVPSDRMKSGREHRVPLSARAVELLAALPREGEIVFVSPVRAQSSISDAALLQTVRRLRKDIVPHGFRSTFSDWAHERTNFANHAIELSLAHTVGKATENAYRRGDMLLKRRLLMDAWTSFVTWPPAAADVVPIRARG